MNRTLAVAVTAITAIAIIAGAASTPEEPVVVLALRPSLSCADVGAQCPAFTDLQLRLDDVGPESITLRPTQQPK